MTSLLLIPAVVGYLLGSIPFAVILARARGVDIFKEGSGNPGATNVRRVLGKGPGNLCFALDCAKGLVAALWPAVVPYTEPSAVANPNEWAAIAGLVGAILGHSFSVFLRFRGGKGVAVTVGGVGALYTPVMAVAVLVWVAVFYSTRVVALASIALALALPVANLGLWFAGSNSLLVASGWASHAIMVLLALVIVLRHQSNLRRLREGKEHSFKGK